jgi:predicted helicase
MSSQLIHQYYTRVDKIIQYGGSRNESSLRFSFQTLLEQYCADKDLELIAELDFKTKYGTTVLPDGTLKDALRQDWGYWESKDQYDTLDEEIGKKFEKGYPKTNILFEDSQTAVLIQSGQEVARAKIRDPQALHSLLVTFLSYEPPEVKTFRAAIEKFKNDLPDLLNLLRQAIEEQATVNQAFASARQGFLELCKDSINPYIVLADIREMIIQHILTEDIFVSIFDEDQFHRENNIACELQKVISSFFTGMLRKNLLNRISPYINVIKAAAANISDHHEKQRFLKVVYENFYKTYNPAGADRLGIVYTPNEVVRFMIEAADFLVHLHFGRTLADRNVQILDPATGTGTFITELIEYLPNHLLPYKYENEIHCNEVAILPYYVANLNIEYTYKQKIGQYVEFKNICFVDTLDNLGFDFAGKQYAMDLGMTPENTTRIKNQNDKSISVIIGNPPYNANQLNENENNKNREYRGIDGNSGIDKRISETYIRHSTAQKTKLYDMYARFIRWASDRLDKNGVIAFVSNRSFIDARTYDGFRKAVAEEFNEIYIIDMKGNARTSGEHRRQEGGNVFSDQIRVGVAVYFLVRREGATGCKILYNSVDDFMGGEAKKAYLRDNKLKDLPFEHIRPDSRHNWLGQAAHDWSEFLPIATRSTDVKAVFKSSAPGINTARDEWVFDIEKASLATKVQYLIQKFNEQIDRITTLETDKANDPLDYSIKWSAGLKSNLMRRDKINFKPDLVVPYAYRPFIRHFYYAEKKLSDRLTSKHYQMFGNGLTDINIVISIGSHREQLIALATKLPADFHFTADSKCLPLYCYNRSGDRFDNINRDVLQDICTFYEDATISSIDIFHYTYAILHHPAYLEKYRTNLLSESPRIPFYNDFWKWANWGSCLVKLHANYENANLYPLERLEKSPKRAKAMAKPRAILKADKVNGAIELDTLTTLKGVPACAWSYKLGSRSAIEWVLEYYKEKRPRDATVRGQFNTCKFSKHKEEVVQLLQRVCTVSIETMRVIGEMTDD